MDHGTAGLRLLEADDHDDTAVLNDTSPGSHRVVTVELLPPGARVGRYIVLERVGQGGMGDVYAAFDPELDRRVALKILHPEADRGGSLMGNARVRMQREAQAMARVSHPNVISVFDVGAFESSVFVAMELVTGVTLRQWLDTEPRTVERIVATFVQAGHGLAAAHAAGLVHRDFKPDNVLVSPEGPHDGLRVRVLDFGLARTEASLTGGDDDVLVGVARLRPAEDEPSAVLSSQLTHAGAIVGTPRYMAPEQHVGVTADARCDQFGFCVALYEALFRQDPYAAQDNDALALAKLEGRVTPPPADSGVPAGLVALVLRGLAPDPNDRWPDMRALVERLARDPASSRRRRMRIAAAVALTVGVAAGVGLLAGRTEDPCGDAEQRIAGIWDDDRRAALHDAMLAAEVPYAATAAEGVTRALDDYVRTWVTTSAEACAAAEVRRERSSTLYDRQLACLAGRRQALTAVVDALTSADAATIERAQQTTRALPSIAACTNTEYLLATLEPPPEELATAVAEIRQELEHARAQENVRPREAAARAAEAHARALTIGYAPVVAEALVRQGSADEMLGDYERAQESLVDGLGIALAEGHDECAAEAAERLVAVVGVELAQYDEGLRWARVAGSIYARLGLDEDKAFGVEMAEANVLFRRGEYRRAGASYERAIAAIEGEHGPDDPRLVAQLTNLGNVLVREARMADALASYERAGQIAIAEHGGSHPLVAIALAGASHALSDLGRYDEAEARAIAAREVFAAGFGDDHPHVVAQDCNIGLFQEGRGDLELALATFERCRARQAERFGPEHPEIARVLGNLGRIRMQLGRLAQARDDLGAALAIQRKALGNEHDAVAATLLVLGMVEQRAGQDAVAAERFAESLTIFEKSGADTLATGRARFEWARARRQVDGPGDATREAATRARVELATGGPAAAPELAALDAWLAEQ